MSTVSSFWFALKKNYDITKTMATCTFNFIVFLKILNKLDKHQINQSSWGQGCGANVAAKLQVSAASALQCAGVAELRLAVR